MTAKHPSIETIADHLAALLPPERQASVGAHLSHCADCTAAAEAVDEVSRLLAQTSADTVPMPAGVAARLDEALRSAGEQRTADNRVGPGAIVVQLGRPSAQTPRGSRRSWALLAAAAAAVVAVGTVVVGDLDLSPDGSADSPLAADAPVSPASDSPAAATAEAAPGAATAESTPERGSDSGNEKDNNFAPARSKLTRLSPASLPLYAAGLTRVTTQDDSVSGRCAPAPGPVGDVISTVRWKGARATVVVDADARQATVFDCETASTVLFRTGY